MSAPIVKPEVVFIDELLEEIAEGIVRVPRFQRPFFLETFGYAGSF